MQTLLTYDQIDQQQWQELVQNSAVSTWFQTDEAYRFYQSVGGMKVFAYGVSECRVESVECKGEETNEVVMSAHTSKLKGVAVGYITCEKNPIKQFLTRRAIIIGGPLLAEDISDEALAALLQAIRKPVLNVCSMNVHSGYPIEQSSSSIKGRTSEQGNNSLPLGRAGVGQPIYIETRNFHDYSKWKSILEANGFTYQPHYDIHVKCNAQHQMSERRQRELKRAIKNGAVVCEAQSEQEIRDWYQILHRLYREKVRTPLFSEEFFLQFHRNGVGKYLLVKYEGKAIGGMMCPILEGKAIYEWYVCGLDEEYRDLSPSVVATHAAIEYAKAHGLPLFDFMGAGVPDQPYGVRDFKMEFGGELVEYGRFLCVCKPLLYRIGKIGVKLIKRNI